MILFTIKNENIFFMRKYFFNNSLKMDISNVITKIYNFFNSYFKYIDMLVTILYISHIKNYPLKMLLL